MKPVDLSVYDAEFPPYLTRDPNEPTFGDLIDNARRILDHLATTMAKDRSYNLARRAMNASEILNELLDDGWLVDLPFSWTPPEEE